MDGDSKMFRTSKDCSIEDARNSKGRNSRWKKVEGLWIGSLASTLHRVNLTGGTVYWLLVFVDGLATTLSVFTPSFLSGGSKALVEANRARTG
jgi:hypothetical protein